MTDEPDVTGLTPLDRRRVMRWAKALRQAEAERDALRAENERLRTLPSDNPAVAEALLERDALAARVAILEDKVEGLEADLESAVEVAYKHGAVEWTRLNYPEQFAALQSTGEP